LVWAQLKVIESCPAERPALREARTHYIRSLIDNPDISSAVSIREEKLLISSTKPPSDSTFIAMLSQNSTAFPGRHHRHNSTPTKFDNPKNISPVAHRRGLSSDQLAYTHQSFVLPQQNDMPTSVEYTLGQQLTQTATMRETQPQLMDRPGFDQQEMYEHSYHAQTLKEMPCPAHGTGAFSQNYLTTPIMEFDNQMPHSLQEAYNLNTMDFLRLDSTASAGNLDGFGNGLDGNIGNIQPNGIMKMKAMPQSIGSTSGSRPTSREGAQVPCTPPSQMRTSK